LVELGLDDLITLTGYGFESRSVNDTNIAATVLNETQAPKITGARRNTSPTHPQHLRNEFMSELEFVPFEVVSQ
jgi:hypothetical protein